VEKKDGSAGVHVSVVNNGEVSQTTIAFFRLKDAAPVAPFIKKHSQRPGRALQRTAV
jgi:hypothetical protein